MSSTTTKTVVTTKRNKPKANNSSKNRKRRLRKQAKNKQAKTIIVNDQKLISKCVREYAGAVVNPFGTRGVMPCIPDNIILPSMKIQTRSRGVFSTGTMGVGFVTLNPWLMVRNDGGFAETTHSFPITYTLPEYTGFVYTNTVVLGALPVGVTTANSNSMFDDGFIANPDRQLRLVAAGLKVTYIGSNFRNQGRLVLARNQSNAAFDDGSTTSDLLNDNYNQSLPISRKSEYVFYSPDSYFLNGYNAFNANYDPNNGAADRRPLLIMIDGGDTDTPQSWQFEAVAYFEIIGPNLTLSKSHSDPEGLAMLQESLPIRAPTATPKVVEESVMNRLVGFAKSKLLEYGPAAAGYAANFVANRYLSPAGYTQSLTIEDVD
jgi:hypothetical protein